MKVNVDILIFGAGIAGLWTAARLRAAGYSVLVLETQAIGGGQTLASQGIIHAGLKYALMGQVNDMAKLVAGLAVEWQAAIAGKGPVDLRGTKILATTQHLLMHSQVMGTLAGAMGHAAIGKSVGSLKRDNWPLALKAFGFKGSVIHMDEPGIDVPSLLAVFMKLLDGVIYQAPQHKMQLIGNQDGSIAGIVIGDTEIYAHHYIGAAAAGNEFLAAQMNIELPVQHRPLRMVLLKGQLPQLFLHGVSGGFRPVITVSAHPAQDGETVWYIGGQVAEDGVQQDTQTVLQATRTALHGFFPNLDMADKLWAVHDVTRVESKDPRGWLPDKPFIYGHQNMLFSWPNKLTLAPLLAREILTILQDKNVQPGMENPAAQDIGLPPATIAAPIWEHKSWQRLH